MRSATEMRSSQRWSVVVSLVCLASCRPGPDVRLVGRTSPLVGAAPTEAYPAVGVLSFLSSERLRYCTGTLVGPCWVLTAAHCVDDADTTADGMRFHLAPKLSAADVERGSGSAVERFASSPDYADTGSSRIADVALVRLSEGQCPIVTPMTLSRGAPEPGLELTLVGYGATDFGRDDYGTKRVGSNRVDERREHEFTLRKTRASDAMICSGDSGGPALARFADQERQVGVHSRGGNPGGLEQDSCGDDSIHFEARVDRNVDWLLAESGGEILVESAGDVGPPTVVIERPKDGDHVPSAPEAIEVAARVEDDTRVQYVDFFLAGKHLERLTRGPYRLNNVSVEAAGALAIEVLAVDATGKEARSAITVSTEATSVEPPPAGAGDARVTPDGSGSTYLSGGEHAALQGGCAMAARPGASAGARAALLWLAGALLCLSLRRKERQSALMLKYRNLPMDLADASLVALAEELGSGRICSTDQRDFGAYPGRTASRSRTCCVRNS